MVCRAVLVVDEHEVDLRRLVNEEVHRKLGDGVLAVRVRHVREIIELAWIHLTRVLKLEHGLVAAVVHLLDQPEPVELVVRTLGVQHDVDAPPQTHLERQPLEVGKGVEVRVIINHLLQLARQHRHLFYGAWSIIDILSEGNDAAVR